MSEEILLNVTPMETRAALVGHGVTQEIQIERTASRGMLGNIYVGKVVRVLPGTQSAFVDIGAQRNGFIHVSEIQGATGSNHEGRNREPVDIRNAVHEGKKLIVQVTREPLGNKGARLTTQLSLSTRYMVLMPQTGHIGISRLIDDAPERERLQQVLSQSLAAEDMSTVGGFILRTAAQGVGTEELRADLRFLKRLWESVSRRGKAATKVRLLYGDLPLQLRIVRDLARPSVERILVDSQESFLALQTFCEDYIPEVAGLLEHYHGDRPLFDLHGVEDEIQRALARRVELRSGGYLVIDQTEAMTTIDVNTGSYVGQDQLEETLLQTNLEAASVLARQLRLRNLGGLIVVDFIDMQDQRHRQQLHHALETAMQRDPAPSRITGVSELGLIQMTRKRSRESLAHTLCEECPACQGRGIQKSAQSVCYDIMRQIMRDARASDRDTLMVLAAQVVVDRLLQEEADNVSNLEKFIGKTISFRAQPGYSQEHFDIVLL